MESLTLTVARSSVISLKFISSKIGLDKTHRPKRLQIYSSDIRNNLVKFKHMVPTLAQSGPWAATI
jgi:hypothetical protein